MAGIQGERLTGPLVPLHKRYCCFFSRSTTEQILTCFQKSNVIDLSCVVVVFVKIYLGYVELPGKGAYCKVMFKFVLVLPGP